MEVATPVPASDAHVVDFYANDDEMLDRVARYFIEGLVSDGAALVFATATHRRALGQRLAAHTIDVGSADGAGTVIFIDAAGALGQFMIDGVPQPDLFASVMGDLMDGTGGGRVRVYGEMVQLLWEAGNVNAAMELEGLWNDLGRDHNFCLYCSYRSDTIGTDIDAREAVCRVHSALVGPLPSPPLQAVTFDAIEIAELASASDAPGEARRILAETLRRWGWPGDHQAAALIVTELSTNAVVHARSRFRICIIRTGGTIRISVADLHPSPPVPARSSSFKTSGRGLDIVAALAVRWGHEVGDHGKEVWAEIEA
jgi:hypothetical protein